MLFSNRYIQIVNQWLGWFEVFKDFFKTLARLNFLVWKSFLRIKSLHFQKFNCRIVVFKPFGTSEKSTWIMNPTWKFRLEIFMGNYLIPLVKRGVNFTSYLFQFGSLRIINPSTHKTIIQFYMQIIERWRTILSMSIEDYVVVCLVGCFVFWEP